ncbi:hypothetical protein NEOKW01_0617 [Nematocida sp. AWRm80]|nr:hypothetical protein NEOKW01_0617 [Nematocida sp. AWRm80]
MRISIILLITIAIGTVTSTSTNRNSNISDKELNTILKTALEEKMQRDAIKEQMCREKLARMSSNLPAGRSIKKTNSAQFKSILKANNKELEDTVFKDFSARAQKIYLLHSRCNSCCMCRMNRGHICGTTMINTIIEVLDIYFPINNSSVSTSINSGIQKYLNIATGTHVDVIYRIINMPNDLDTLKAVFLLSLDGFIDAQCNRIDCTLCKSLYSQACFCIYKGIRNVYSVNTTQQQQQGNKDIYTNLTVLKTIPIFLNIISEESNMNRNLMNIMQVKTKPLGLSLLEEYGFLPVIHQGHYVYKTNNGLTRYGTVGNNQYISNVVLDIVNRLNSTTAGNRILNMLTQEKQIGNTIPTEYTLPQQYTSMPSNPLLIQQTIPQSIPVQQTMPQTVQQLYTSVPLNIPGTQPVSNPLLRNSNPVLLNMPSQINTLPFNPNTIPKVKGVQFTPSTLLNQQKISASSGTTYTQPQGIQYDPYMVSAYNYFQAPVPQIISQAAISNKTFSTLPVKRSIKQKDRLKGNLIADLMERVQQPTLI